MVSEICVNLYTETALHGSLIKTLSDFSFCPFIYVGPVAQSVQRLTTGWTVWDRIPVGTRFSTRPDRPWGPPSLLQNGHRVFSGSKVLPVCAADLSPLTVPRSWKSRAIPLTTLWAHRASNGITLTLPFIYRSIPS